MAILKQMALYQNFDTDKLNYNKSKFDILQNNILSPTLNLRKFQNNNGKMFLRMYHMYRAPVGGYQVAQKQTFLKPVHTAYKVSN